MKLLREYIYELFKLESYIKEENNYLSKAKPRKLIYFIIMILSLIIHILIKYFYR